MIAQPETGLPKNRPNDAHCDRAGRYWCGTMEDYGANERGTLYRIDADLTLHAVDGPFFVPTASPSAPTGRGCLSPTPAGAATILALRLRRRHRRARRPGVLLAADAAPGRPDGSCIDADGCLWNARYGGSAVVRVTPDGRVDRIVELPASQPTCCAFGGARLDELYITTAAQRLDARQLAAQPAAGSVLVVRPGVSGIPEARFAG